MRWVQYGVFSPINRLHSNNKAMSKEPWNYPEVESIAEDFLRLRHALLPYLYTANVRTAKEGVPLVCPMYYYVKNDKNAYSKKWRNQYFFGEQMLVCPITKKSKNGVSKHSFWLPEGNWIGFFDGKKYEGGKVYEQDFSFAEYPVFVKEGGIIPMTEAKDNSTDFSDIKVRIYLGENEFTMYDEQGKIDFDMRKTDDGGYEIEITPTEDIATKKLSLELVGVKSAKVFLDGEETSIEGLKDLDSRHLVVDISDVQYA